VRKLSSEEIALIRHLVTGTEPPTRDAAIDWDLVTTSAGYHRLAPLLFAGLKQSPFEAKASALGRLEKAVHVALAKTVVRLNHIDALEAAAERTGRTLCLLKGAAFAGWLYPNPASRPMADVDALVHPEELPGWVSEILQLGFRHHESSDHATCFRHRHTGVFIELHQSLTSCNRYLGVKTSELLERSLAQGSLRTLRPEDHLMHLCLHASVQHGFRQPAINARDANLLVAQPGFDRQRFLERASRPRWVAWIYGGLRLSHLVFPSAELHALAQALRDAVPHQLVRKLSRLDPADGLSPDPRTNVTPPFRRLLWAGDISTKSALLIEVLRPRGEGSTPKASSWARRVTQLLWNHGFKNSSLALMKQAQTFLRPTPASLGEVRDV
jgi:hypothetical protein